VGTRRLVPPVALLDIDGTLVDNNYHHALSWYRAFRAHGLTIPVWRIHRRIGMGGDQLVADLCAEEVERERGDDIRASEKELYEELLSEVEPVSGARELMIELRERGHTVVLASSADPDEVEHHLDLLDARELADHWTTAGDVETAKPAPDLVEAALERAGAGGEAALVGDTRWDCEAARRAGIDSIGMLTGGFSEGELREAGAAVVFETLEQLRERLDETPLAARR
jgi:HAD superfamily hydrolase (TIGR01509 family)